MNIIKNLNLDKNLEDLIKYNAVVKTYEAGIHIVSEGVYKNETAFIESGVIKVFTEQDNSSLLLYYLSGNTKDCIINFMNIFDNSPVKISLMTITECKLYWVPNSTIIRWSERFLSIKSAMLNIYLVNSNKLIDRLTKLTFLSLEERVLEYYRERFNFCAEDVFKVSHATIARDLNVSREAVSRSIKRLQDNDRLVLE